MLCSAIALLMLGQFFPSMEKKPEAKPVAISGAREFDIRDWTDTGIDVKAGDTLRLQGTGTIRYAGTPEISPGGGQKGWKDLLKTFPVNDAGRGALVGRIGDGATARAFLIGESRVLKAPTGGRLFLGLNQPNGEGPEGSLHATVELTAGAPVAAIDPAKLPKLTQQQLDSIPARVVDAAGTQGDRVNFIIIGSEQKVVGSLLDAGWIKVNRTNKDAVIGAAISVLNRRGYTELPMSTLMMFGRGQDYGFAMGDPVEVILARHHFRIWKAPFTAGGQQVWVGAGTHDIGFDKDQRNGNLTHKIDPDTDKEREFIGQSLQSTGRVAMLTHMTRKDPVTKAKTAHGEEFFSDGRTLVIVMAPDDSDQGSQFSSLFCSVLKAKNPDGGDWGECSQWIDGAAQEGSATLAAIPNKYRILIVPGLMNTCFRGAPPFKEGVAYLQKAYGLTVDMIPLPNDSSEDNAKKIAEFLKGKMQGDSRKYIAVGYSKGAPDFQVALAKEQGVKDATAAFVSLAGAISGSPIADSIPGMADQWIRQYNLPNCEGDLAVGFKSLSSAVRKAFLNTNPDVPVPSYSLSAVSGPANTSTMLVQTKLLLDAFSKTNDSQLTEPDQIVPGSKFLGRLSGDHFAVALPFETSDEAIKSQADKNHFPRSALLEAIVRFVIQDLP